MKMKRRSAGAAWRLILFGAGLALCGGCRMLTGAPDPHFRVEVSFRDYVVMVHQAAETGHAASPPLQTKLELSGSGHLKYTRGRSRRVRDGFWKGREDDRHWGDLYTDQMVLSERRVQQVLQVLVDAGLFEGSQRRIENASSECLLITARIDDRRNVLVTDQPAFLAVYRRLAAPFE